MGGAIGSDNAGPIQAEEDRQLLNADVVDNLVKGSLQEGGVNCRDGAHPLTGQTGGQGNGVLLGNPHVDVLVRQLFLQLVKAGAGGHGGSDADNFRIIFRQLDQGFGEYLGVAGGLGLVGRQALTSGQVEGGLGVVADLVFLSDRISLALSRGNVDQHGTDVLVGFLKGVDQLLQVVAIYRTHVGEAQFLKYGPDLRYSQTLHPFFDPVQFRGEGVAHKGQVLELLFQIVGQETEPAG